MASDKVDILVVDDLPEKLLVYRTILESLGENVVTVRSGRDALRLVLEREFAVILLDVNMPEMDGFETAALIRGRRQSAHVPIIFVTAMSDEMNTAHAYSLGAVDFILSPVVPEILRTKVGVFIDLHKKSQQIKRQAEESVALARVQAARDAAEETNRRLAFLAEASAIVAQSLDYDAILGGLAGHVIPFLGDLCAVSLIGHHEADGWRTDLAWIDPVTGSCQTSFVKGDLPVPHLSNRIKRVVETGQGQIFCDIAKSSGSDETLAMPITLSARDLACSSARLSSALIVPLRARGRTQGTIAVGVCHSDRRYCGDDLALAEDLADRAAIAIDNARLYRDVQENDRRKNEFLAILAHELRNPLAPLRNAVEILRRLDLRDETLGWANDVMSRQIEQLVRLVDDLLDVSRISGGKIQLRIEPIDAATVVTRAVETSRPSIDARQHVLNVRLPSEPLCVNADLVRLAQVLSNLLNNAAKFTQERGAIDLEVERVHGLAVFRVRDNGMGIPTEKLSSIFDLFTQVDQSLDRSQGGLGVGLALVRRLVEEHGGTVSASSEGIGSGSEFVIRLPELARTAAAMGNHSSVKPTAAGPVRRRVLVVDDYPLAAESLMRMLQVGGHDARIAQDGLTALEQVRTCWPEIVLLDIGLPGMDGYKVAESIRSLPGTADLVLIALSGYAQLEDRRRSAAAGFNYHLTKPVDAGALFQLISRQGKIDGFCLPNSVR
jgi:signal transduction histidine kinase/DNA-binding response OmpR family regulator